MSDELSRLLLAEAPIERLREAAVSEGMRTLRADALDKVAAGITSLEELARVVV
jgi:type II secretory ATPase GspE/PulE/Tfp pilus assembly ATPase PilB-like protein